MKLNFLILLFFSFFIALSQKQSTKIVATLDIKKHQIYIQQEIVFNNSSNDTLKTIYLHNWMNSYRDNKTPLSNRLLEDYDKSLYFANKKNRGFSKIINISNKFKTTPFEIDEKIPDIIKVSLHKNLNPNDSIVLSATYIVKVPHDKFTHYGRNKNEYNLRFWYLTPAVYDGKWQLMSNYNMDDLFVIPTHFDIQFKIPKNYFLITDLSSEVINNNENYKQYILKGNNRIDVELNINKKSTFYHSKTKGITIISNIDRHQLKKKNIDAVLERQVDFITSYLGKYPHDSIMLNKINYDKNPVYGLNQLPKIFNPFKNIFEYDLKIFKVLTNKFINNTIITNRRNDTWLNDGIQTYLMMEYVKKYYPEIKALGEVSNIWGFRTYQVAKLKYNEKYGFVHQFAMRKNLDQALTTRSDSLSTFNRKIVNKYKSGLGLQYLNDFLGNDILEESLQQFYVESFLKKTSSISFQKILKSKTNENLDWFFGDYLQSNKKIDFTIKKIKEVGDSLKITIKNKRNFNAPISVYGIKNKEIKYKKWFKNISNVSEITIPKGDYDRVSLNYESIYPELNLNDNWKKIKPSLFNRPVQFRYLKDIDNPYYNQFFYNIEYDYNYYDGILVGLSLSNKTLLKKKWFYKIKPTYGFNSKKLTGAAGLVYTNYYEDSKINKFRVGFGASNSHYAPNLSYLKISPFISFDFRRKSLRDVGGKRFLARFILIEKEIAKNTTRLESDNYKVFNARYSYRKPEIIKDIYYNADLQLSKNFSKLSFEVQYRKLSDKNKQFDIRLFAGTFLHNNTTSSFFDYSLNRPTDYLFDFSYFGRSEQTGFLSQQIIIAEGGFKSIFEENTANKWMLSTNGSIGIWRWIELYGDAGFYKNNGFNPVFKYDSGIRFNFVNRFFEIYFPIQSSNGFELNQNNYHEKIRFVATLSFGRIYNFIKRGFY